jgi:hypothetical protein
MVLLSQQIDEDALEIEVGHQVVLNAAVPIAPRHSVHAVSVVVGTHGNNGGVHAACLGDDLVFERSAGMVRSSPTPSTKVRSRSD